MGIGSTLLKGAGGTIFTLALFGFIFAGSLGQFTAYDNLKQTSVGLLENALKQLGEPTAEMKTSYNQIKSGCDAAGGVGELKLPYQGRQLTINCADLRNTTEADAARVALLASLKSECAEKQQITLTQEIVGGQISVLGTALTLKCADVNAANAKNVVTVVAGGAFDSLYNRQIAGCDGTIGFITCLTQKFSNPPEFAQLLLTARANQFLGKLQTFALIGVVIGVALLAVSIRKLSGIFKAVGIPMLLIGTGYFVTGVVQTALPIPAEVAALIQPILTGLLGSIQKMMLYPLVIGAGLTAAGFVLGFLAKRKKKMPEFV